MHFGMAVTSVEGSWPWVASASSCIGPQSISCTLDRSKARILASTLIMFTEKLDFLILNLMKLSSLATLRLTSI